MIYSPLRYPGGKNKLSAFIAYLCKHNNINEVYAEPYSGGASVGLFLLINGFVNRIIINDKDRSLYAFWYAVLNHTDELIDRIYSAQFTIEEWFYQKSIQKEKEDMNLCDLGFSTFYLNRTNRSGIISGGVIGGLSQNGPYLMDCRFKKNDLVERIKLIASKKDQISLSNYDAIDLIEELSERLTNRSIIYIDPPYFNKGSTLYLNHYNLNDHIKLSEKIKTLRDIKWIISYDNTEVINNLYSTFPRHYFSFKHTAFESRVGKEVLFFSSDIKLPEIEDWTPLKFVNRRKNGEVSVTYKKSKKVMLESVVL